MKCALAAVGFLNESVEYNKTVIIDTMKKYAGQADVVIFGEAFLQGFYGINFSVEHDTAVALHKEALVIQEICEAAKKFAIAVSFGFIEKDNVSFFSSQITIDKNGQVIDLYRRISPGWKEKFASEKYCEGEGFHTFDLGEKKVVIGLCGDLWYEENIHNLNEVKPDIVWWPVYTDFHYLEWNNTTKFEYAEQAGKINAPVLYVNSVCIDKANEHEIAKGGAVLFDKGKILKEIPAGNEGILYVEC